MGDNTMNKEGIIEDNEYHQEDEDFTLSKTYVDENEKSLALMNHKLQRKK